MGGIHSLDKRVLAHFETEFHQLCQGKPSIPIQSVIQIAPLEAYAFQWNSFFMLYKLDR